MESRLPHLFVAFLAFAVESLRGLRHCELQALHLWVWKKKLHFSYRRAGVFVAFKATARQKPTEFLWILAGFGDVERSAAFGFSPPLTSPANHNLKEKMFLLHWEAASRFIWATKKNTKKNKNVSDFPRASNNNEKKEWKKILNILLGLLKTSLYTHMKRFKPDISTFCPSIIKTHFMTKIKVTFSGIEHVFAA